VQLRIVQPDGGDRPQRPPNSNLTSPSCDHDVCITCTDSAVTVRIDQLLSGGFAKVEAGGALEEISVELIEAEVGDLVLVHAGVAIGKL
jgi:hydrogenase maturation factor